MMLKEQFTIHDKNLIIDKVRSIQFATCIIFADKRFITTSLPLRIYQQEDQIIFQGHVSRGNEIWRYANGQNPTLVIFQGPNAYIHPGWYETKKITGRAVPTWNYEAFHFHGTAEKREEISWLTDLLERMVAENEEKQSHPWKMTDAPAEYIQSQLKAIVGLEIRVQQVEAVAKMSQNHPAENRLGVINGLSQGSVSEQAISMLMRVLEQKKEKP